MLSFDEAYIAKQVFAQWPDCPAVVLERYLKALTSPAAALVSTALITLTKPYGRNNILSQHGEYGMSLLQMEPGQSSSFHRHSQRKELFVVRTGRLTVRFADHEEHLGPGECSVTVPPVAHAVSNQQEEPLEVLEMISPFLLDDKIRIHDRYQRRLGAVTHRE
jgi:mannose-6-phosphate isomerase-like protein (cupin superfamily)